MRCYVCSRDTPPRKRYCSRCRPFVVGRKEQLKRRAAMREAYDRDHDAFRDHWTGVTVDLYDPADPFHLAFDHVYPIKSSRLVVCSELSNRMKTELGPDEFRVAVAELVAHRAGAPFRRDIIAFEHWDVRAPRPRGLPHPTAPTSVNVEACVVCGRPPVRWSYYCSTCHRFLTTRGYDRRHHVRALREAWSPVDGAFLCWYTGVRVDVEDPASPWYLTYDHRVPGDPDTIVVAAAWINAMKTSLSDVEFWAVLGEYDKFQNHGGEFDRDVVPFDYW